MKKIKILLVFLFLILITNNMPNYCPQLCDVCDASRKYCSSCYQSFQSNSISQLSLTGACSCPNGYYYNTTTELCLFCPITCSSCTNYTTCTSCIDGYMIDNNKKCTKKLSNQGQWLSIDIAYDLTNQKLSKLNIQGFYLINYVVSNNISKIVRDCFDIDSQPFFGLNSFDYDTEIIKSYYGLPTHDWIEIRFQFIAADKWEGNSFILEINDQQSYKFDEMEGIAYELKQSYDHRQRKRNFCIYNNNNSEDKRIPDNLGIMTTYLSHTSSMLKIRIRTDLYNVTVNPQQNGAYMFFGIRQVFVRAGSCPMNCEKCRGPNFCGICRSPYIADGQGNCVCDLSIGQLTQQNRCIVQCKPGFIFGKLPTQSNMNIINLNESRCILCSQISDLTANCFICSKNSYGYQCSVCLQGYYLYNGQCLAYCPNQYEVILRTINGQISGQCKACPNNCKKCKQENCIQCSNTTKYNQGNCTTTCQDGFYLSSTLCLKCKQGCSKCISFDLCAQCSNSSLIISQNGKCVPICQVYSNCSSILCDANCDKCYGITQNDCLSCKNTAYFLQNSKCVVQCSIGYFSLDKKCLKCVYPCNNCSNYQSCLRCQNGFYLNEQKCLRQCPLGYYPNNLSVCKKCSANCVNCTSQQYCQDCTVGYILFNGQCVNKVTCSHSLYYDNRINKCMDCPQNCLNCYRDLCYQCDLNTVLDNGKCLTKCVNQKKLTVIQGEYNNGTKYTSNICEWKDPLCSKYQQDLVSGSQECAQCIFMNPALYLDTNKKCTFNCPIRTVKIQSNNNILCQQCPLNCLSCYSNSTCIKCDVNYVINPFITSTTSSQCITSCPSGYVSDGHQCLKCKQNCKRCQINGRCIECISNLFTLTLDNNCVNNITCTSTQYYNSSSFSCFNCPADCISCFSPTKCTKCGIYSTTSQGTILSIMTFLKDGTCVSNCNVGYFSQINPNICIKCPLQCATCVSQTQCTSCLSNYYLLLHPIQKYQSQNITIGTCVPQCPFGYFNSNPLNSMTNQISQCRFCSLNCLTCFGPSQDQCLSCYGNFKMDHNSRCVQLCPFSKYQDSNKHCDWCHPTCIQCTGPAQFQCKICNVGYYLYRNVCYKNLCPGSTYIVDYDNRICQPCQWGCQVCTTPYNCTVCTGGFYLYDGWCYLSCPENTNAYLDLYTAAYRCGECNKTWSNCVDCYDKKCLRCNDNYILSSVNGISQCVLNCSIGYYISSQTIIRKCIPCPNGCATCQMNSSNCLNCISGYVLLNQTCTTQCPVTKYFSNNPLPAKCLNCSDYCLTCSSSTKCINCQKGFYLMIVSNTSSYCLFTCGSYKYKDQISGICRVCSTNCIQCTSYENCTKCITGKFLKYGYCYDNSTINPICNYSNTNLQHCAYCINPNFCQVCQISYYLFIQMDQITKSLSSQCLLNCPSGYFNNGRTCSLCNASCVNCYNSANNCSMCQNGFYLYDFKCMTECPGGYFKSVMNSNNVCMKCDSLCYNCVNSTYCENCLTPFVNYLGKCYTSCPQGTFLSGLTCISCSTSCKKCQSLSYCLQCKFPYILLNNKCVMSCPQGYYLDPNTFQCKKCQFPCLKCKLQRQCITCVQGFYLFQIDNGVKVCINQCPKGYFKEFLIKQNSNKCSKCRQKCQTCLNQQSCVKCNNNFMLFNGTCVQKCNFGFYADNNNICRQCGPGCILCTSSNNCIQCHNSTILFDNKCLSFCPSGTYPVSQYSQTIKSTRLTCKPCLSPCLTCNGSSMFNCITCIDNYYLLNNYCLSTCPQGYYPNIQTKRCQICPSGCKSCNSFKQCIQCQNITVWNLINGQCQPNSNCSQIYCQMCQTIQTKYKCWRCIKPYYMLEISLMNTLGLNITNITNLSSTMANNYYSWCVIDCPTSTFKTLNYSCMPCPANCSTCYFSDCSACKNGFYLYRNTCIQICPNGYKINNLTKSCQPTPCLYYNSAGACEKCLSPYLLLQFISNYTSICLLQCPQGYYKNQGYCMSCKSQQYHCLNCISLSQCKTCQVGYFKFNNKCINQCQLGYYKEILSTQEFTCTLCSQILQGCMECASKSICKKCQYPYYLAGDRCVINCPNKTYQSTSSLLESNQQCKNCQQNCIKCFNSTQCTKCNNNTLLFNGDCLFTCPIGFYKLFDLTNNQYICSNCNSKCMKCSSLDNCIICMPGYNLLFNNVTNQSMCVESCPKGYYQNLNNFCVPCSSQCLACNMDGCTQCPNSKALFKSKCSYFCPEHYYSLNNICSLCNAECKTCNQTASSCTSCYDGYILLNTTKKCILNCTLTSQYYDPITYKCFNCSTGCQTCYGPRYDQCISCKHPLTLFNNQCILKCPEGYFKDMNNVCRQCDVSKCQTCENTAINCTTCYSPLVLKIQINITTNSILGKCDINCGIGYYYEPLVKICIQCSQNCKNCLSKQICLQCITGTYLYNSQCITNCPNGFVMNSNKVCQKCPMYCDQCSYSSTNQLAQCINCRSPYNLYEGKCYQTCPTSSYLDINSSLLSCSKCQEKCIKCTNSSICIQCQYPYVLYNDNCLLQCPADYYAVNYKCYPIIKCRGYLYKEVCYQSCLNLINTYPLITTTIQGQYKECKDCPYMCNSCVNDTYCLNCKSGAYLLIDDVLHTQKCLINCPVGYYVNNLYCIPCSSPCLQCMISLLDQSTQCISCTNGYLLLNGKCVLSCPTRFYQYDTTSCKQCDSKCATCNQTGCITCTNPLYNPTNCNQSNITCLTTQYVSSTGQCQNCNQFCLKCYGSSVDQCLTCKNISSTIYYLYQSSCVLDCPDGFMKSPQINKCQKCLINNCKFCTNNVNTCNTCMNGYILYNYPNNLTQVCILSCNELSTSSVTYFNYFNTANNITQCTTCEQQITNCLNCYLPITSTSNNLSSLICVKCKPTYKLYNNICYNPCPTETYSSGEYCIKCLQNCQICTDTTSCTSCKTGFVLYQNKCISTCPLGYFNSSNICLSCSNKCIQCTVSGCTQCVVPYKLDNFSQCSLCLQGYYANPVTLQCIMCNAICLTCVNNSSCTSCKSPLILFNNQCLNECPLGYYFQSSLNLCTNCNDLVTDCQKCSSVSGCQKCKENYYLTFYSLNNTSACTLYCPSGYFKDIKNMKCVKCTQNNCQNCLQTGQCNQCSSGYYLFDNTYCIISCPIGYAPGVLNGVNVCIQCKKGCKQCSPTIDTCILCEQNLKIQANGQCSLIPNSCQTNQYLDTLNNICRPCYSTCLTCYGTLRTNCLTCRQPEYKLMKDNFCQQTCIYGQYYDSLNSVCALCSSKYGQLCIECNSTQCFQCSSGKLSTDYQSCISSCPISTYQYNNQCYNCSEYCKVCTSSTYCTQCLSTSYIMYNNQCYQNCPSFTYLNVNNVCTPCDSKCISCSGSATNCSSCKNPYKYQPSQNACVSQCQLDKYVDVNNICQACTSPCLKCVGTATNCTSCILSYYLSNNQCYSSCPSGQYSNMTDMKCYPCNFPCKQCVNNSNKCTSCQTGYIYQVSTNTCTNRCTPGFYLLNISNNLSCQPCSINNCLQCNSANCYSCKSGYWAMKNQNNQLIECVINCSAGYYKDSTTYSCQKCSQNCIQCTSKSHCQKCQSPSFLYMNFCVLECPQQTYKVYDNMNGDKCQQCGKNCKTCIDNTQCTQCLLNYKMLDSQCIQKCPAHYYTRQIDNSCQPCDVQFCDICSSMQTCDQCLTGYTYVNGQCIPENCLNCDICDYSIKPQICQQCTDPYFLYKNRCIDKCPIYYYQVNQNGFKYCQKCVENCEICIDNNSCQQCIPDYIYVKQTNKCQDQATHKYGSIANISGFTSNITQTMATIYLSTSVGPMAFGQMSNTYFNIQFTQFMFFHQSSSGGNKQMTQFLNSLQRMSFTQGGTTINNNTAPQQIKRRRLLSTKTQYTQSFIEVNAPIFILMFSFLGAYICIYLFQRFITQTCRVSCNNVWFYLDTICTFVQKRFKWIYFDFIMWMSYLPFLFFALIQLQQFNFHTASHGFSSLLAIIIIATYPLYPFFIAYLLKKSYDQICIDPDQQQSQIKQTLTQMSLSPYLSKVKRPQRDYVLGEDNFKLFTKANFRLIYYPLKYLRKFIFVVIAATITDPITTISILIGLNVAFIVYMILLKPRIMPYLVFDLIIEFVLLAFEAFLLIYLILDGPKIAIMSIVTHVIGFIFANLSLFVAIILNLIAYYNIFMCIKDLISHISEKASQRRQAENKFEIQKKFLDPNNNLYIEKDIPKFKGINSDQDTDQDDTDIRLSQEGRKLTDGLGQKQLLLNGINPIKYLKKITKGQNFEIQQKNRALKMVNQDDITDSDDSQLDQNAFNIMKNLKLNEKNLALNEIHPVKFAKQLTKNDAELEKQYKKFDQKHVDKRLAKMINSDGETESNDSSIDEQTMDIAKKMNLNQKQLAFNNINPMKFLKEQTKKDAPLQDQYKKFDQKHIDKRLAKIINEDQGTDSDDSQIDQDLHNLAKKLQLNEKQLAFNQINPMKFLKEQTKKDAPLHQQYQKFDQKNMDKKLAMKINQQEITDSQQDDDQVDQNAHNLVRKLNLNQKQLAFNEINPIKFFKDQTKNQAPLQQIYKKFDQKHIDRQLANIINDDADTDSNKQTDSQQEQNYRIARDLKLDEKQLALNNINPMKLMQNQAKKDNKLDQIKRKFDQKDIDLKVARLINDNGETSQEQDSQDSEQNQKIVIARQLKLDQKQLAINNINPVKLIKQATIIDPQTNQPKIDFLKNMIGDFSQPKKKLLNEELQMRNQMRREMNQSSGTDQDQDQNIRLSKNTRNKLQNMSEKQMMMQGLDPKKIVKQLTKEAMTKKMMDKKQKQTNKPLKRILQDQIPDFKMSKPAAQNKSSSIVGNILNKLKQSVTGKKENLKKSERLPSQESNSNKMIKSRIIEQQSQAQNNLISNNKTKTIQANGINNSVKNNVIGQVQKNMVQQWDDFQVLPPNQIINNDKNKINDKKTKPIPTPTKVKLQSRQSIDEDNLNSQQSSQMGLNMGLLKNNKHQEQRVEHINLHNNKSSKNINSRLNIDLDLLNQKNNKNDKLGDKNITSSKNATRNIQKIQQSYFDQFKQLQKQDLGKVKQKKITQKKYHKKNTSQTNNKKSNLTNLIKDKNNSNTNDIFNKVMNQDPTQSVIFDQSMKSQHNPQRYSQVLRNNKLVLKVPQRFKDQLNDKTFQEIQYQARPESKIVSKKRESRINQGNLSQYSDDQYSKQVRNQRYSARQKLRLKDSERIDQNQKDKNIEQNKSIESKRNSQVLVKQRNASRLQRMKIDHLSQEQDDLEAVNL